MYIHSLAGHTYFTRMSRGAHVKRVEGENTYGVYTSKGFFGATDQSAVSYDCHVFL